MISLKYNNSIETFSVKLNESALSADNENVVFTDKHGELCNALEDGIGKNTTIKTLELVNLRYNNNLIDSIGKGIKENTSIKTLDISGNLIVSFILSCRIGLAYQ